MQERFQAMFTGIIEGIGRVRAAHATRAGVRLSIDLGALARGVKTGDSIAVDGCCLTVARLTGNIAQFDLIPETLRLTTFPVSAPGHQVNLERASRIGDRLDGHIVQGHVDAMATVVKVTGASGPAQAPARRAAKPPANARSAPQARTWTLSLPAPLIAQLVPKGSIALDGISLTIASLTATTFTVAIIPETLARTTLGSKLAGAQCHVELDVLGKFVHRYLEQLALSRAVPARAGRARRRR